MNAFFNANIFYLAATVTTTAEQTKAPFNPVVKIVVALVVGLIVGLIYAAVLKGQLTSVYKNDTAADYTREGSFSVPVKRDLFIYSKTEKKEKPKPQPQQQQPPANNKK